MLNDKEIRQKIKRSFSQEMFENLLETGIDASMKKMIADQHEEDGQYDLALKWYRDASASGDADSMYKIGRYYETGKVVNQNLEKAYIWYIKAAEKGNPECLKRLAPEYYLGSSYCQHDPRKAKSFWTRLFIREPEQNNEKSLNTYFPDWKRENEADLNILEYKSKKRAEIVAQYGVAAAAYWIGINLYGNNLSADLRTILGYEIDKDKSRRWLLKAALIGFLPAEEALQTLFSIDTNVASTGEEMYKLGNSYAKDDASEQDKDLRFFWLRKSVDSGFEEACNNLGVCYDGAIGTEKDYEKANNLYLRAIRSSESGAAYYNYGLSLYYGTGVAEDENEAKRYLLISRKKGHLAASKFLKEHYGIVESIGLDYSDFDEKIIFNNVDAAIEFCGIQTTEEGFAIKFWYSNKTNKEYHLWINNLELNDSIIHKFYKVGTMCPDESESVEISISHKLSLDDHISFRVGINDEDDIEICETNKLIISVNSEEPEVEIIGDLRSPFLSKYAFIIATSYSLTIYEDEFRIIQFGGFSRDNENISLKIWVRNTSGVYYQAYVQNLIIDGKTIYKRAFIEMVDSLDCWQCIEVPIKYIDMDTDSRYEVRFGIVLVSIKRNTVVASKRIKAIIDFSEKEVEVGIENPD